MKRVALSLVLAAGMAATSAMAADMATKAPPVAAPPPNPWDVAITAALMTDYNFRGITQSSHNPSTQAGFEARYTVNPTLQYYAGISGESIDFPNHAAAEIDYYGGFRPTFDKLALDFGFWYYDYPGGQCFFGGPLTGVPSPSGCNATLANGNVAKESASFYEWYGKATYTVNDQWAFGLQEWYSPSVANTGSVGWFTTGNGTFTAPSTWFTGGFGGYISADLGYWDLGKSDAFYGVGAFGPTAAGFAGDPYKSYWTWDVGVGFTYKAFTLDLRYYDTNLNKGDCNAFTSDFTAGSAGSHITAANPSGVSSNWCSAAYIAKLSFATNLSGIK
jgi:uncharacterized protein (TIGR02001 family)